MTINSPQDFMAGMWDWAILDGCFGQTRIRPGDIDGLINNYAETAQRYQGKVGRHGRWLLLEAKKPGVELDPGQERDCVELAATGIFTCIVVWGLRNVPSKARVYLRTEQYTINPCDLARFRFLVARWYEAADISRALEMPSDIHPDPKPEVVGSRCPVNFIDKRILGSTKRALCHPEYQPPPWWSDEGLPGSQPPEGPDETEPKRR